MIQIGTPREIYFRPANDFVAKFVGSTNLLDGKVVRTEGDTAEVEIAPYPWQQTRFGLIYFWVALGRALGGAGRYWCNNLVSGAFGHAFPWGTLHTSSSTPPAPVEPHAHNLSNRYCFQVLLDGVDDVTRKWQVCLCGGPVLMKERDGFTRRVKDKL